MNHHIEYLTRTPSGLSSVVTDTSVIDVQDVLDDIRSGEAAYWVGPSSWDRTRVRAVPFRETSFLFANWDGTKRNNLHDLALAIETAPRGSRSRVLSLLTRLLRRR